eukprot:TRINITY_DN31161_c0_g1_i1.p1 TRINITY_DN31161_c0_g1~~TRINITY_DN31161_c0_g1_i1.p1  ORF type:complete len:341 (+),score=26.37 TRINITY_DN31161_c0_g1_i1:37-1059(+)
MPQARLMVLVPLIVGFCVFKQLTQNHISMRPPRSDLNHVYCKTMKDIYPGRLIKSRWVPDNCYLRALSLAETQKCLAHPKFYAITDSLGREIYYHLRHSYRLLHNKTENSELAVMDHIWTPQTSRPFGYLTQGNLRDTRNFLRESAEFILFSNGLWDVGSHFCGPIHYFEFMVLKVKRYLAEAKSDVRAVLYNIPYIHHVEQRVWGTNCNIGEKLKVYREALELVSACTGVPIFDTYQMQKQYPDLVPDGVHAKFEVLNAIVGLVLNTMCLPPEQRVEAYYPNVTCSLDAISEAKERWAAIPLAMNHSQGCPKADITCFTTPSDYLRQGPLEDKPTPAPE